MPIDFTPYDAVLLDLDGTIYHEENALPGAIELIHRFQKDQKPFACLTNSTSSPILIGERLARMGVLLDIAQIHTAGAAAVDYILATWPNRPRVYSLATEGVQQLLEGHVTWVNSIEEGCDVVLAGTMTSIYATDDRLRTALAILRTGGVQLVGICADRVYPSPRGIEFGSGALTALLSYAANVRPIFTGKPEAIFFQTLCQALKVRPDRCILIGDNLESDIAGARNLGMATVLTLTGVTPAEHLEAIPVEKRADFVVHDLTDI